MFIVIVMTFFLFPASLNYHVTEQYNISGDSEDAFIYLSVLVPKSDPYQWVGNVAVDWNGNQQIVNYDHVDAIRLSGKFGDGEDIDANISYDVKLKQDWVTWEAPVETFQNLPQKGIESDHYLIQERASELSKNSFLQGVPYSIYSFTSDYLTYSQMQNDCASSSALMSYEIGSCVCAGYARLMVALSRASQIPAQMVVGFLFPDPIVKRYDAANQQNPGQAHAWVEYYSFGKWKMADPTLGSGIWKRIYFNRNDGRHIAYGELEQLSLINTEQQYWALSHADISIGDDECFKYTASTNSDQVSIAPTVLIRKGWDGRWLNSIIIWAVATFILCKYRNKIIAVSPP
ncbi:MAG: transglutaminase domain-containing protein [Chloroflexi bacterium]|nr:transglutaminase domain-containing protein [Chloroflexota bacterium]